MKLIKQPSMFVIKSKYESEGYEETREYRFAKIEDVLNFLNGEIVKDIYHDTKFQDYHEIVVDVYEKIEYELNWELDDYDDDYIWTLQ